MSKSKWPNLIGLIAMTIFASVTFMTPVAAHGLPLGTVVTSPFVPAVDAVDPIPEKGVATGTNKVKAGTSQTIAMYCPAAAAAGTCTGESLSDQAPGYKVTQPFVPGVPGVAAVPAQCADKYLSLGGIHYHNSGNC